MSNAAFAYAQRDVQTLPRVFDLIKERDTCIQAGACLGVFPKFLAKQFRRVFAFEPDPVLFRKSVIYQEPETRNIVWVQAALGSKREPVRTECMRRDGDQSRPAHAGLTYTVPDANGITPTMLVDDLGLQRLDLLCLDIEGNELNALIGAQSTLLLCKPVLVIEINKQVQHSGYTEDDVRHFVKDMGYEFKFKSYSDEVYAPC